MNREANNPKADARAIAAAKRAAARKAAAAKAASGTGCPRKEKKVKSKA